MSRKGSRNGSGDAAVVIVPGFLYLGPLSATASTAFMSASSISDVLSIGSTPTKRFPQVTYHRLALTDSPNAEFDKTLDQAIAIIDSVATASGTIFVHCSAAISRSPSVVTGYLMKKNGMTLCEALGLIVRARPAVSPNTGFLRRLQSLDEELYGTRSLDVQELPRKREDRLELFKGP